MMMMIPDSEVISFARPLDEVLKCKSPMIFR